MDIATQSGIFFQILIAVIVFVILVVLVIRRISKMKEEDFEKRDN